MTEPEAKYIATVADSILAMWPEHADVVRVTENVMRQLTFLADGLPADVYPIH